ncbi:MAG: glucose-6-phosphate isomerase [Azospirillum sp.]|uniref:glucose-6-phosphate isomerase n=1 Tax=Candidatus Scatocola faecigallinarum TaxID=2840916 RepID=UPI00402892EB|nr:glucose-6-phosphate isomerase [Azospirillum sp.]
MFEKTVNKTKAWKKLESHYKHFRKVEMKDLFACDADRAKKFSVNLEAMYVDYSKNRINDRTMKLLLNLARECDLENKIKAMFKGDKINVTERRPVLHIALRNRANTPIYVDGKNVMPQINEVLAKMKKFSDAVRFGEFKGQTGKKLTNIVNIGIGGSDLGPVMACEALRKYWAKDINCYFISNIDGTACAEVLNKVDPETTLFIVASKTFTTIETLTNAKTCRKWLVDALGEHAVAKHFVALSTNTKEVEKFGINPENMFEFWDFVGGRYSMWSAIGLIIAIAVGFENFERMLEGAYAMDQHFYNTDFEHNIPVILGMLGIWYNNFFGLHRYAVIPYDQYLQYVPMYLQQLDMESNGKFVAMNGEYVKYATGPVLFGGAGTNVQHSFFQLIHQGTEIVPMDFVIPAISHNEIGEHHEILVANVLAQGEALMRGKTVKEAAAELKKAGKSREEISYLKKFKSFEGNRPSNTIVFKKMDPYTLGMLIAMYEHKVFVQGVVWNVDSFDQYGVELGKQMALSILPELQGTASGINHDGSTNSLIGLIKRLRK